MMLKKVANNILNDVTIEVRTKKKEKYIKIGKRRFFLCLNLLKFFMTRLLRVDFELSKNCVSVLSI